MEVSAMFNREFELPFVPFVVVALVVLCSLGVMIDHIQTAPAVAPTENFNEYTNEWFVHLPAQETS